MIYKPGDPLTCRVEAQEPGGYSVTLLPSGIKGFLPSQEPIAIGRVVPSTFVCMNGEKALLSYAFIIGTTERVQLSTASNEEMAFSVWADSNPVRGRLQRAVDLFMPPIAGVPLRKNVAAGESDQFIARLEQECFTGCVKVDSESRPSRSAALFYKGRAVGGIYTKKSMREPYPIQASLMLMLEDLRKSDTEVEFYVLPDDLVLSLSSLFLGVSLERDRGVNNDKLMRKITSRFKEKKTTGCISLQETVPCALGFIFHGKFIGAYSIEERRFDTTESYFLEQCKKRASFEMEAFLLPEAVDSDSMLFGYSLSAEPFTAARV